MVHISRYKLRPVVYDRINVLFYHIFSKLSNKNVFSKATDEIFTSSEKVMFMKRVALVYMVLRGASYREAARTLKVSTGTVSKFSTLFKEKESVIAQILTNLQADESVINLLDDLIFNVFNQRGYKKGHWQEYWNHEKRKQNRRIMGI